MPKAKKIRVDQERLNEVCQRGKFADKNEAINASLAEFIRKKDMQELLDLRGKIKYDDDWTPRKARGKV
ncbi:MAG: type II toxin-antitoxin system VapB family antitoxin [Planctomycetota bacterium]|nr:type II toxin-antitoxin system VapB family antitoxin [Planctomycetota bacterium]